jgi:hypothetical protein
VCIIPTKLCGHEGKYQGRRIAFSGVVGIVRRILLGVEDWIEDEVFVHGVLKVRV